MARLYHNPNELYLKCGDCDAVFRHDEAINVRPASDQFEKMWQAPCCERRYSLIEARKDDQVCAIITHGYGSRKARDKHDKGLDSLGIGWVWEEDEQWLG